MVDIGKFLIVLGIFISFLGVVIFFFARFNIPLGRLPGDILVKKENFTFYFPITTSIVISVILSLVAIFLRRKG